MVVCKGKEDSYLNVVTNGAHELRCDIPIERGGGNAGFMPSALLEAALASCINITVRKFAANHGIKLTDAVVKVSMNRDDPNRVIMEQEVHLLGDLTEKDRKVLLQIAGQCPVKKLLTQTLSFNLKESDSEPSMDLPVAGRILT